MSQPTTNATALTGDEVHEQSPIDSKVRQVVENIRNLPTPSLVFSQIQKVIHSETASAKDVARILSEDPSMSAKVLKMTNSAFYGLSREIDSVQQAVMVIGFEAVKNLVLSASVLAMFKGNDIDRDFQERYWRHSLATAFGSRMVAKRVKSRGPLDAEACFSAGLLHDIGKLVMACFLQKEHAAVQERMVQDSEAIESEVELEILGYSHAKLGAALAENWGLSSGLIDAISYHDDPQSSPLEPSLSYAVNIGNYISKRLFEQDYEGRVIEEPSARFLAFMDVAMNDMDSLTSVLREEYSTAQTFVSIAGV
ncbi:HDOD domain-containing protein [bacterium AH-315-F03]|nr:HDOD domain-containing protein [bacterium AH-315-F03]